MTELESKISELEVRLDQLMRNQIDFQVEVLAIRKELSRLRGRTEPIQVQEQPVTPVEPPRETVRPKPPPPHQRPIYQTPPPRPATTPTFGYSEVKRERTASPFEEKVNDFFNRHTLSARADLEKFIGENLISKIGILILIIGIGIGVKYSIDNNLISPLTRITLGYIFGFGLVGLAIKLKAKYHNFSAVLISGGISASYFVTYFGYTLYSLLNRESSFGLMAIFTVAAVAAALVYNRQVIAHIGLVGAYAVPFLLTNDSGNYLFLFIYMSVINAGILAISLKRRWVPLYYTAFGFTWIIFASWFATRYSLEYFGLALVFLAIFFAIFLTAKLVHTRLNFRSADVETMAAAAFNSVVFYGFCLAINNASLDDGNVVPFFTYLAAITAAVLALSLKFIGKPIFYTSFGFTWLIFISWFAAQYRTEHFITTLIFLGVFFAAFFAGVIYDEAEKSEGDSFDDVVLSVLNCIGFYGICLALVVRSAQSFEITILFTYLSVFTVAILLLSFRFFGKVLVYLPFASVWLIYAVWYGAGYDPQTQFEHAAVFAALFFATFYVTTIAYKIRSDGFNVIENSGLILANSFLFYGFGYSILDDPEFASDYLGLYTAAHGVLHLAVAGLIGKVKDDAADLVQILTVVVLTFATIAIPVQFDGNVVTLVWAVEAALLFWMGRTRGVTLFEYFSYPLMALASVSLTADWTLFRGDTWRPIANGNLITALVFAAAFGFIYLTNRDEKHQPAIPIELAKPLGYVFAVIALFVFYNAFRLEIVNYFDVRTAALQLNGAEYVSPQNFNDLRSHSTVWQVNYTLFFLAVLGLVNQFRVRARSLAAVTSGLAALVLTVFATLVMALFYDLRVNYQGATVVGGQTNIAIRYISYVFAAGMLVVLYRYVRDELLDEMLKRETQLLIFEAVFYAFVFIVGSCELVNLMGQFYIADATKLGLSIFWGLYALAMVVLGIAWDKKHLRIAAMALLGVTLAKLFFYDISDLGTIPKTVLFVTLGITLLVISFLYNKYKAIIFPAFASATPKEPDGSVTEV